LPVTFENAGAFPLLFCASSLFSFHNSDFVLCQSSQLIDELFNLPVRRRDLALDGGLVGRGL